MKLESSMTKMLNPSNCVCRCVCPTAATYFIFYLHKNVFATYKLANVDVWFFVFLEISFFIGRPRWRGTCGTQYRQLRFDYCMIVGLKCITLYFAVCFIRRLYRYIYLKMVQSTAGEWCLGADDVVGVDWYDRGGIRRFWLTSFFVFCFSLQSHIQSNGTRRNS